MGVDVNSHRGNAKPIKRERTPCELTPILTERRTGTRSWIPVPENTRLISPDLSLLGKHRLIKYIGIFFIEQEIFLYIFIYLYHQITS